MSNKIIQLANEAIQLEYNVGKLYIIFRDICEEDAGFWWQLVIEENNHAALIKIGVESFIPAEYFPEEILPPMLDDLTEANKELLSLLEQYENNPPSRETAFNLAFKIETSAGEIHFQTAMSKSTDSESLQLFQKLNQDDKDHCKRIKAYMKENGIEEL